MDPIRKRALLAALGSIAFAGVPTGATGIAPAFRLLFAVPDASVRPDWDAVLVVESAAIDCNELEVVALADGRLIVDEDVRDGVLTPFADAVEKRVAPPYRATLVRLDDGLWGVGVSAVTVLELPDVDGDRCEISRIGSMIELSVDGRAAVPGAAIAAALAGIDGDVAITAEWLEDSTWIANVWPL